MSFEQHSSKISSNTDNQEEGTAFNATTNLANLSNINNPLSTGGNGTEIAATGKSAERNEIRTYMSTLLHLIISHFHLEHLMWNDESQVFAQDD